MVNVGIVLLSFLIIFAGIVLLFGLVLGIGWLLVIARRLMLHVINRLLK